MADEISEQPVVLTGAALTLHSLAAGGITHLFVNLGSDHPAFLAAFASKAVAKQIRVITCPNEMNALSAASGYAQITGRPAAVLVHVECGTQALAGAIHNVCKARVPVVILAGMVPITAEGEMLGSRNEYIHWIQDVPDQRGIVRQYMKYDHEIRAASNIPQIVFRALQFVNTEPHGPVYLMAGREVLEQEVAHPETAPKASQAIQKNLGVEPMGLPASAITLLVEVLTKAARPLIITSYTGRSVEGFEALRSFAEMLSIPVHESAPRSNNFPTSSFLHQGHVWNSMSQLPALAEADVVLVLDSDVPWIPAVSNPNPDARIFHIDSDPLKPSMTLWSLPCERRWQCSTALALKQLTAAVSAAGLNIIPEVRHRMEDRTKYLKLRFEERTRLLQDKEQPGPEGRVTVPFVMSRFRAATAGLRVVALNESTTNLPNVADHLGGHSEALTMLTSGAGSLGWYSGAAIGASLALSERGPNDDLVVCFTGDGTWLFGVPSAAYWMSKRYETPFLTIVWNNGGWGSPKNACLKIHPDLKGVAAEDLMVSLSPSPSFGKIAEGAAGAWWKVINKADEIDAALTEGVRVVREEKRCALIEVVLPSI